MTAPICPWCHVEAVRDARRDQSGAGTLGPILQMVARMCLAYWRCPKCGASYYSTTDNESFVGWVRDGFPCSGCHKPDALTVEVPDNHGKAEAFCSGPADGSTPPCGYQVTYHWRVDENVRMSSTKENTKS